MANRYLVSRHADLRMRQRGVRPGDLHRAWKVFGSDMDGDELVVVVAIEDDGMLVVTVY